MERRTIDDLIRHMKGNLRGGRSTALLIGAGCSKEAGIPLASEFVQEIKKDFPDDYELAKDKTSYAHCMGALSPDDRHALIAKYIDNAKINRAHIAIAQLMKHKFVDRVLTTNFDSLVVRAGALSHLFPAVYDMAASPKFSPEMVGSKAVFHLHGQRDGFVQHHMPDQFKKLEGVLGPLFSDTNKRRTWVVVGYSGENDPVFKQLEALHEFGGRLYWVTRGKDGPPKKVVDALSGKAAFWVSAPDADTFFYNLARELDCLPPEFFDTPFTHLKAVFDTVADSKIPGDDANFPWLDHALAKIDQAVEQFEKPPAGDVLGDDTKNAEPSYDVSDAITDLMAGRVDDIVKRLDGREDLDKFKVPLSWAYVGQAEELKDSALSKTGVEADALFTLAYVKYTAALETKPEFHEALSNWGTALADQAKQHTGAEADALFVKAYAKYTEALEIKPDEYTAQLNWGLALAAQAPQHTGAEANALFVKSYAKYATTLEIKPDEYNAQFNWGNTLAAQAQQHTGAEADALLASACAKYAAALEIKPDYHEALYNWGNALAAQAKQQTGAEADALLATACAKYAAALEIKSDFHEALNNWGAALFAQAEQHTGTEADALFVKACAKYAEALEIKPNNHEALNNWGVVLKIQAQQHTGAEADALLASACAKYAAALENKPDYHEALYNWGNALAAQAQQRTGAEADALFVKACAKYVAALKIKPDFHEALNSWGTALSTQAQQHTGAKKEALFAEAKAKYMQAEKLAPGSASYNLACLAALRSEEKDCQECLEKSWKAGELPTLGHLQEDEDLDFVRKKSWFKAFLKKVEDASAT